MTIEEVVREVLREEHGDVIRESVKAVARELMEAGLRAHRCRSRRADRGPRDASQRVSPAAVGHAGR
jgi:hypothetical protein